MNFSRSILLLFIINLCLWRPCISQNMQADSLEQLVLTSASDSVKLKALHTLFDLYEFSNTIKAKEALLKAVSISRKNNNYSMEARSNLYLGYLAEDTANYKDAINAYEKALLLYQKAADEDGIAAAHSSMGNSYMYKGDYPNSLLHYFNCLKVYQQRNDRQKIAKTYNNLGIVYNYQENYTEALKYENNALTINRELGDKNGESFSLNNLGISHYRLQNYLEALDNYSKALEINLKLGNKRAIASGYNNLGLVYNSLNNLPLALKYYQLSADIKEEIGDKKGILSVYMNTGIIQTKLKNFPKAKQLLSKALELSKNIGSIEETKNAYGFLLELDSIQGDGAAAFEDYKFYVMYRDSIVNIENTKKIVKTQMQYQFDMREAATKAEQEKKDALAAEEQRKQQLILVLASIVLLLVVVFAVYVARSLQTTRSRKKILASQKQLVEQQKDLVEEKQKELLDSIYYARRIQRSLLPTEKYIHKNINRLNPNS